ncbi:LytTR family transcriptional regulator [Aquimarina pacifica]|uniref:LytTR family transcriptional regulator n=1 Tax=Aquimarina pacifica TaxID=1296415 RepID=UPI00046F9037|nr:LytTR family transcriptional regulator [Aquimarina pacifica]
MRKDKLYFLTFLSLFTIVYIVGYFSVSYLLGLGTEQFLKIQIESSKRESRQIANFMSSQIKDNVDKETIIRTVQKSIENTNTEIGFICVFDRTGKQICHPDPRKIGKKTLPEKSYVSAIGDEINAKDFYSYLQHKKEGGGIRNFIGTHPTSEIIYIAPVDHVDWIVAGHANMDKINEEHDRLKTNFIVVYIGTGTVIVLLSFLMVRLVGSSYERRLELKNEKLSEEVLNLSQLNQDLSVYKAKVDASMNVSEEVVENKSIKKRILTYAKNELVSLDVEDIAHIYMENTIIYVKSLDGKTSNSNSSLEELYSGLDSTLFFRANRQFILSVKSIDKILKYGNNQLKIEVVPKSPKPIIISKNKVAEFRCWLNS